MVRLAPRGGDSALAEWFPGLRGALFVTGLPPLTAAAARHTLDSWNPGFCKVVDFYGFYVSGENSAAQEAYVLIANPGDKVQKPVVYAARFQLLTPRRASRAGFSPA